MSNSPRIDWKQLTKQNPRNINVKKCFADISNGDHECKIEISYEKNQACAKCGRIRIHDYLAQSGDKYVKCAWCMNTLKWETLYNSHTHRCREKPENYDKHFCLCPSVAMFDDTEQYNVELFEENNL